jgi:hypothetical protein
MIVETKVLKGSGEFMHGRLDVDGTREWVWLIIVLTIVVRMDVVASRGDGGMISGCGGERCVEKKTMGK